MACSMSLIRGALLLNRCTAYASLFSCSLLVNLKMN
ncbi:hypothetical protein PI125_g9535 [Phytophthora idaei]|nr:hypothetical protein PI125_g9535 [Phytophthora idaei]